MAFSNTVSTFRALHQAGKPFILANAWDAGSAKLLTALGAQAIATTSAGHAFTLGVKDMGEITLEQSLAHAKILMLSTPLPVSGDLENGYGHRPETVAKTITAAGAIGLAGACIEDTALPDLTPYAFEHTVERIEAAADAAQALETDFVLTARADGIMLNQYDLPEAIRRIKAFESAGADVIYVPMPHSMEDLNTICAAVDIPVNALAAGPFAKYTVQEFANIGVARISLGSALARITHAAIINASKAMFLEGDLSPLLAGVGGDEIEALFDLAK
ncbi:MAG: isocitrate lyase/phosphoenolpyruvate mutase family protein [Arenicellales bacterium]